MLDLDHFKHINDTYGHSAGDVVLQSFAQILRNAFRVGDAVGRFGGDEFVVLLVDLPDPSTAERKALQVMQETMKIELDGKNIGVSVSIGIALAPHDGMTYDDLFQKADQALYNVKSQGRNGYSLCMGTPVHGTSGTN